MLHLYTCGKIQSSPCRMIQQQLGMAQKLLQMLGNGAWSRSGMCHVCNLPDRHSATNCAEEMLTRVRQGEEQKHKHKMDPEYQHSFTLPGTCCHCLVSPGMNQWCKFLTIRVLYCTAQPSCMGGVPQAWGQTWQDGICPPLRGCRVQVSPRLIPAPQSQPQGQCFK